MLPCWQVPEDSVARLLHQKKSLREAVILDPTCKISAVGSPCVHRHVVGMLRFVSFGVNQSSFLFRSWRLFLSARSFHRYFIRYIFPTKVCFPPRFNRAIENFFFYIYNLSIPRLRARCMPAGYPLITTSPCWTRWWAGTKRNHSPN